MATKKARASGSPDQPGTVDLTPHPLVNQNHPDPDDIPPAPPDVIYLVGYIGASKRPDYTRLYQDLSFRNYYEIPTSGIVSTTPVNADDENSPTHLQVLADTKLDVITVSVQSVEARFLSGSISSGYLGASGGAGAQQAAAAQVACTNITTYVPSCVAQQAQQQRCDPNCVATIVTSHVDPPVCITLHTANPSNCPPQYCITLRTANPSACDPQCRPIANTAATVCTQKTPPDPRTIICPTLYTANPSNCATPICITLHTANPSNCTPQCNPYCAATVVTSHIGTPVEALGAAAAAIAPTPPVCITLHTANPSNCAPPPICITRYTAIPSNCEPQNCITLYTANPSNCVPQFCIDLYTANPTHCGTVNVNTFCCGYTAVEQRLAGGAQAAPQPYCITVYTHAPTYCAPPCRPIANTAATLCTQTL